MKIRGLGMMMVIVSLGGVAGACAWADGSGGSTTDGQQAQRGAATSDRVIRKEVLVSASQLDVWRAWTTTDGVKSFFGPEADIELSVGGKYEVYFAPDAQPGSRGSDGCKVLAFLPGEMLAFSWNAPPSIPELRAAGPLTQVVVQLKEAGEGVTRVVVTHHDIGEGDEWDKYLVYFEKAWDHVLAGLQERFKTEKVEKPRADEKKARGS